MIILRKIIPEGQTEKCIAVAEELGGTQNGNNQTFTTPREFTPGRISLLYNGQALHSPDDFTETDTNEVTLIYIKPYAEDVLRATYEYSECSPVGPCEDRQSGRQNISYGVSSQAVSFTTPFADSSYVVTVSITNEVAETPSIYPTIVGAKTQNGFTVYFAGDIDSSDYVLEWVAVGQV